MRTRLILLLLIITVTHVTLTARAAEEKSDKAVPAAPRHVNVENFVSYPPIFVREAGTLDPMDIVSESWKGWMSKRGIPWGMMPGGKPIIRLSFDCRALPWPSIKQHSVDGPDNNMRSLAAHAALHAMLGDTKDNDSIEEGHIGYLLSCTDPECGIPYSPDSMHRSCAVGHGEFCKNLILLYEQTGIEWYKMWAEKALQTLRRYAIVETWPNVGKVAWYPQGMFVPGNPPVMETNDVTLGGWQHLAVGWNLWAFAEWYRVTGDKDALDFAIALANRLMNSGDPDGNDGSFRPDGSFGGKSEKSSASWHMHGHTHCLPGLVLLGEQLIKVGRTEEGLRMINQAQKTFDWLYDPANNPDAGSMTGWLGEWLMVATGWERQADCEGCTIGDVVQTATALGSAAKLDARLAEFTNYYDRAEQIFRGQLVEQRFRLTPAYLAVLKQCLQKQMDKEVEQRYAKAIVTAEKMVGQQLGACGFPDWVNKLPSDLDPNLPGIHMQGCCADATVRGAYAIWSQTVTGDKEETRVNMAFNRKSPLVNVVSCLPHRGEINVIVKTARRVLVRIPQWAPKEKVEAYVQKNPIIVEWDGCYVVFDNIEKEEQLTVTYPIRIAEIRETPGSLDGTEYTEKWRGNTIVDISPFGKMIPMFQRMELDTAQLP